MSWHSQKRSLNFTHKCFFHWLKTITAAGVHGMHILKPSVQCGLIYIISIFIKQDWNWIVKNISILNLATLFFLSTLRRSLAIKDSMNVRSTFYTDQLIQRSKSLTGVDDILTLLIPLNRNLYISSQISITSTGLSIGYTHTSNFLHYFVKKHNPVRVWYITFLHFSLFRG